MFCTIFQCITGKSNLNFIIGKEGDFKRHSIAQDKVNINLWKLHVALREGGGGMLHSVPS
jgi:hypothetical protein